MASKARRFTRNKRPVGIKLRGKLGKRSVNIREKEVSAEFAVIVERTQEAAPEAKKPEIPSNSQKITESPNLLNRSAHFWQQVSIGAFLFVLLILSLWQADGVVQKAKLLQIVISQRRDLLMQQTLWESIAQKYSGYRDAYFQVAVLSYRLGEREKSQNALQTVFQLDPNYQQAKKLLQLL